jgi:regulator of protease activity HflC (stomatin/prohibitin superfamily)
MFWRKKTEGEGAEQRPPKRGWILVWSIVLEGLVFGAMIGAIFFVSSVLFSGGTKGTASMLFIDAALVVFTVCLMAGLGFLLVYFWWAPNNLFWTFVPEGRGKVVVRGDAVKKILVQWKGHALVTARGALRPDTSVSPPREEGDVVECVTKRRFWGGLYLYGTWPLDDLYIYDFRWTNMTHDGQIQPHDEKGLDYVLLKDDVYWAQVKAAEDSNLLPLDIGLVLRLRVVNPYKALFVVENWLETVINMVEPAVRYVVSTGTYENWVRLPKDLGNEVFQKLVAEGLVGTIRSRYGIEMVSLGVKSFDPSRVDTLDETRQATLRQYLAEQERKKIETEALAARQKAITEAEGTKQKLITEGEGESAKIKLIAEAEANRMRQVYEVVKEYGEVGTLFRLFEALEKTPSAAGQWVLIPQMANLLSQVFPGRDLSNLKPEDIAKLRALLEKESPPAPPKS